MFSEEKQWQWGNRKAYSQSIGGNDCDSQKSPYYCQVAHYAESKMVARRSAMTCLNTWFCCNLSSVIIIIFF